MTIRSLQALIRSRIAMLRGMFSLLTADQQRSYRRYVGWMFCSSLVELFTFGIFVSFLKIMTAPDLLATSSWGRTFQHIAGVSTLSDSIIVFGSLMVAMYFVKNFATFALYSSFNTYVYGIAANLSQDQLRAYYSLDFIDIERKNTSEFGRRTMHVPIEFAHHVVLGSMTILSETMLVALLSVVVIFLSPPAFLLIIGFLLPFIGATRYISVRKLRTVKTAIQSLSDKNAKVLSDTLNGYVDTKLHGKEDYFTSRYATLQQRLNAELATLNSVNLLPGKLSEVFVMTALVAILFISRGTMNSHAAGLSTIGAVFVAFLYRVVPSVNKILTLWSNVHTYAQTITILQPFRPQASAEPDEPRATAPALFQTSIELRNIGFAYEGRNTSLLTGLNLTISKGDIVGIVGKSGSGKTTLLHILLRLLTNKSGTLLMDGNSADDINRPAWQALFAYVKQTPFLLHDTIEANVAFGEKSDAIDRDKIIKAMALAGLENFLSQLPDGLRTDVGERGKGLSGGQKQRLVIARALYRNADIFIFDEATSELDGASEREIVDTIGALQRNGKTIVIASHRHSALIHCSVIYELHNGTLLRRPLRVHSRTGKMI
jgi:ABC-type bacteriocin/lantibiotic exporter with double-glycine peptidase domain